MSQNAVDECHDMTHFRLVVTTHTAHDAREWKPVKARIIGSRFGTISALAAHLHCHPNAIRLAASGKCRRVLERLQKLGIL
jgi:hypothetical protein